MSKYKIQIKFFVLDLRGWGGFMCCVFYDHPDWVVMVVCLKEVCGIYIVINSP